MAVRVQLNEGLQIITPLSLEDVHEAFQKALDRNTTLDVKDPDGTKRAVNPMQILYFDEIDDATAERLLNGAHRRHPTAA